MALHSSLCSLPDFCTALSSGLWLKAFLIQISSKNSESSMYLYGFDVMDVDTKVTITLDQPAGPTLHVDSAPCTPAGRGGYNTKRGSSCLDYSNI